MPELQHALRRLLCGTVSVIAPIVLAAFVHADVEGQADAPALATSRLPAALVAYAYLSSGYTDFADYLKQDADIWRDFRRLDASLGKIQVDVPARMAFVESFLVLDLAPVASIGRATLLNSHLQQPEHSVRGGTLFVIAGGGPSVTAILSSTGPSRCTVFTLANDLVATVVYDSFQKRSASGMRENDVPIGEIQSVRIEAPDRIVMTEGAAKPKGPCCREFTLLVGKAPVLSLSKSVHDQ